MAPPGCAHAPAVPLGGAGGDTGSPEAVGDWPGAAAARRRTGAGLGGWRAPSPWRPAGAVRYVMTQARREGEGGGGGGGPEGEGARAAGEGGPIGGPGPTDLEAKRRRKMAELERAVSRQPPDVAALRRLAISDGGLLDDRFRRRAWPTLLNVPAGTHPPPLPGKELRETSPDFQQVFLDVRRSLRRFPPGMPAEQREGLQEELVDVILWVLARNGQLHYYQGFHDVAVTFLLVLGPGLAAQLLDKLATHHLRDFMDPTMDNTKHLLNYLSPILERTNPDLHDFMQSSQVGTVFALSWLITWFGHVLSDLRQIVRLYDFFLACHPLMPIYFAAVIVLHREQEVLACECDMASVHHLLAQLPQDLPYERLVSRAGDLFVQLPPSKLARVAAQQQQQEQQREDHRTATSTFEDFELASAQRRPDAVLRRRGSGGRGGRWSRGRPQGRPDGGSLRGRGPPPRLVKLAVMGLTVALGAAALAVVRTALDWAPKLDVRLFP
ncbi:TBC1 domain family member 20 [Tachyglossus aculeatus]|uniref:TBC1 domain family member 20 n=1 Tax=Tachyglossus aculeatus TaxID=9261 RepID=UPI0018F50211|nr:TBC1 domain family member 20 [Tachyglossus aculeatus]